MFSNFLVGPDVFGDANIEAEIEGLNFSHAAEILVFEDQFVRAPRVMLVGNFALIKRIGFVKVKPAVLLREAASVNSRGEVRLKGFRVLRHCLYLNMRKRKIPYVALRNIIFTV